MGINDDSLISYIDIDGLYWDTSDPDEPETEFYIHAKNELRLMQSFADLGRAIFKDARPRTAMEAEVINDFFDKKSRSIHYKDLK